MVANKVGLALGVALSALLAQSCTTVDRTIQTPSGQQDGVEGPLQVLRVVRRMTTTGNQPDSRAGVVVENILASCPANTEVVIPVMEQEAYGYGEISPDDLSMMDAATGEISFGWSLPAERPLGILLSGISVVDINAPDARGEQSVILRARAVLSDGNSDDRWWWAASYHILCLGTPAD